MTWRGWVTALAGFAIAAGAAHADSGIAHDCQSAREASTSPDSASLETKMAATRCMIYVKGVVDSFSLYRDLSKAGPIPICLPAEGGNVGDLATMVGFYVTQHPEAAELTGVSLVYATLAAMHKCP